jgi:hypothetical protein
MPHFYFRLDDARYRYSPNLELARRRNRFVYSFTGSLLLQEKCSKCREFEEGRDKEYERWIYYSSLYDIRFVQHEEQERRKGILAPGRQGCRQKVSRSYTVRITESDQSYASGIPRWCTVWRYVIVPNAWPYRSCSLTIIQRSRATGQDEEQGADIERSTIE